MKLFKLFFFLCIILVLTLGCKTKYGFENINIGDAKTFQVNNFKNNALLTEPGIERDFKLALEDLILNKTKLDIVNTNADLIYNAEIIEYKISPTTATANNTASQNRLTISLNVEFINKTKEDTNLKQTFSFFYDYSGNKELIGDLKRTALKEISERISQNIFNKTLTNW